jgi:hypothetical protein
MVIAFCSVFLLSISMPLTLLLFKGMTQKGDSPTVPPTGERIKREQKIRKRKK